MGMKNILRIMVIFTFVFFIGGYAMIEWLQQKAIYFPREYTTDYHFVQLPRTQKISFMTSEGSQFAFYVPPKEKIESIPQRIWVLFGGNAMLALDWSEFIQHYPDQNTGFFLIDYPGYGYNQGRPSPKSILENSEQGIAVLAETLGLSVNEVLSKVHLLGHSLGSGVALEFAVRFPVSQVILSAPFTSIQEVACSIVGKPLCYLITHRFDNYARLQELSNVFPLLQVSIIHGIEDQIIPIRMGRKLAQDFQNFVSIQEIQQADHNSLLSIAEKQFYATMQAD